MAVSYARSGPARRTRALLGVAAVLVLALPACNKAAQTGGAALGDSDSGGDSDSDTDEACAECSAATYWEQPCMYDCQPDQGTAVACYPRPIDFDEQACQLLIEWWSSVGCPFEPAFDPIEETVYDADDQPHTVFHCPLPQIPAPASCAEAEATFPPESTEIGWYFCEDDRENYPDACNPLGEWAGVDEDGDGLTDCDDDDCQPCPGCGGNGLGCADSCKFGFHATPEAWWVSGCEIGTLSCSECTDGEPAPNGEACHGLSALVGKVCQTEPYDIDYSDSDGTGWLDWVEIHEHEIGPAPECLGTPCLDWHWTHDDETGDLEVQHFCTCRCADLEGNDHETSDDLCACPQGAVCEPVCVFDSCPENIQGKFCMPACVADRSICNGADCVPPPPGSITPWLWTCE